MNHSGEIFKRNIGLDELYARMGYLLLLVRVDILGVSCFLYPVSYILHHSNYRHTVMFLHPSMHSAVKSSLTNWLKSLKDDVHVYWGLADKSINDND